MFFRKTLKVSSSLQEIIKLWWFSTLGGFATRLEIANLIRVEPSVRSNPYFDSNSDKISFETLWTNSKVSSEILSPIVLIVFLSFESS